jgi:hypothetical protein
MADVPSGLSLTSPQEKEKEPGALAYNRATLSLMGINTEIWSARLGIGRKADNLTP